MRKGICQIRREYCLERPSNSGKRMIGYNQRLRKMSIRIDNSSVTLHSSNGNEVWTSQICCITYQIFRVTSDRMRTVINNQRIPSLTGLFDRIHPLVSHSSKAQTMSPNTANPCDGEKASNPSGALASNQGPDHDLSIASPL